MLYPFWIECLDGWGVGITAQSETDALTLLEAAFGDERQPRLVKRILDASELDQGHVIPNMGNWLRRGVWFPIGSEHIALF